MRGVNLSNKKCVNLSVDSSIDDFFESFRHKRVNIDGKEVKLTKKKNDLYVDALHFAIEHADKWLFSSNEG